MTATHPPLTCRNCGDSFTAPERSCPSPSPGRPYKECGRGGHMFLPVEPEPRELLSAKRLREIRKLTECRRLQRVVFESARVGGDPVFTRNQIERLFADDKRPRRKRGVKGRR